MEAPVGGAVPQASKQKSAGAARFNSAAAAKSAER
jgi:hypothetical protein